MISGIDHVVILVGNLDHGIQQYRDLGFTVTPGGRHPRFTHNALISFGDGSYLELIAFWETADPERDTEMHRWQRHLAHGGGLIDFAVGAVPLAPEVDAIRRRGLDVVGPFPGARSRPDGVQVAWRSAMMAGDNPGALPFMIEDVTDRSVRVPGGGAVEHANGVRGIRALTIAVADLDVAQRRFSALLGVESPTGHGLPNLRPTDAADGVYFQIGPHRVDLARATGNGALRGQLVQRGDSLFELALLTRETRDIDPAQAGGARIRFEAG